MPDDSQAYDHIFVVVVTSEDPTIPIITNSQPVFVSFQSHAVQSVFVNLIPCYLLFRVVAPFNQM